MDDQWRTDECPVGQLVQIRGHVFDLVGVVLDETTFRCSKGNIWYKKVPFEWRPLPEPDFWKNRAWELEDVIANVWLGGHTATERQQRVIDQIKRFRGWL